MSGCPGSPVEVRAVRSPDWSDVQTVFDTPGDPRRCWCQWFRLRGRDFETTPVAARRAALRDECDGDGPGPGVLARVDGVAAGWAAVAPRAGYPRLGASPLLRGRPADDRPTGAVWAVPCFVVRRQFRGRGLCRALLDGAVEYARAAGAGVLEGYPVDVAAAERTLPSRLYHGTVSTFLAAGFAEVARPRPERPIMRLQVGEPDAGALAAGLRATAGTAPPRRPGRVLVEPPGEQP